MFAGIGYYVIITSYQTGRPRPGSDVKSEALSRGPPALGSRTAHGQDHPSEHPVNSMLRRENQTPVDTRLPRASFADLRLTDQMEHPSLVKSINLCYLPVEKACSSRVTGFQSVPSA